MPFKFSRMLVCLILLSLLWNLTSATAQRVVRPKYVRQRICPATITIPPDAYRWYKFMTPLSSHDGLLQGRWRASGGSQNDLEVYIFDSDGYENFRNGHSAKTYYNSGRATVGTISFKFQAGIEYVLVVSNKFSTFSNKVVENSLDLYFTQDEAQ